VIVYLDVKPERSMERVRMRNRDVETGITLEYLTALYQEYERFIQGIARTVPVIRVDYDRFRDAEEMAGVIEKAYLDASFLQNVKWDPTKA
jgi:deoxyadenosine kinase